jgi:DNA-binding MarR family transcriptional regulator
MHAEALLPLLIADVYELAGRLRAYGDNVAGTVGQTQARWQVMSAASGAPSTVPRIARRLGVTRQNIQRIADLLVAEKLATYEPNPDHRGSPYLLLNARGRATLKRLTTAAADYYGKVERKLSAAELASIHRGLRRLLEATADIKPITRVK